MGILRSGLDSKGTMVGDSPSHICESNSALNLSEDGELVLACEAVSSKHLRSAKPTSVSVVPRRMDRPV